MKQLLSMFAIAMLMVACGESKTAQTEEAAVEEVVVDSSAVESVEVTEEVVEEVEVEGEPASAE